MSSHLKKLSSIAICLALAGCSSIGNVMNPYQSKFSCGEAGDTGSCGSLQTAYAGSIENKSPVIAVKEGDSKDPAAKAVEVRTISLTDQYDLSYRKATLSKLNKLVEAPVTPIVAPPTVMRILMLSYADDEDILNMNRFSYIMLDKPRWVVGEGEEVSDVH